VAGQCPHRLLQQNEDGEVQQSFHGDLQVHICNRGLTAAGTCIPPEASGASLHALGYEAYSMVEGAPPYATVRVYEDEIRSVEGPRNACNS
jgi:hypothetical protein